MGGDKTIGENYAFAGMHHIFDQHKTAGLYKPLCVGLVHVVIINCVKFIVQPYLYYK